MSKKKDNYNANFESLLNFEGEPEEKLRHYQQAIDLADAHNDPAGGLSARMKFIPEGFLCGRYDQNLVHFAKCVQICRADPELLCMHDYQMALLARYTLASIVSYAGATLDQIDFAAGEMAYFYDIVGWGERAQHKARMHVAGIMGQADHIKTHRDRWLGSSDDEGDDCDACVASDLAKSYLLTDPLDQALEAASSLIEGRLSCNSQPAGTDAVLLLPLFRSGQFDFAQRLQRRSFEHVSTDSACFDDTGRFMAYLAATDQLTRGIEMLEAGLANYPNIRRDWDRFWMLSGARILTRRLLQVGRQHIHLRVPAALAWHRPEGSYDCRALQHWLDAQALDIAQRFDARNGNHYISGILRDLETLLDHITPVTERNDLP